MQTTAQRPGAITTPAFAPLAPLCHVSSSTSSSSFLSPRHQRNRQQPSTPCRPRVPHHHHHQVSRTTPTNNTSNGAAQPVSNSNSSSSANGKDNDSTTTTTAPSLSSSPVKVDEAQRDFLASYRLTAGERARTLVRTCPSGTLCTSSVRHSGVPFGSHVDFVQDVSGNPVFLLAANANHTRNLASDPSCSLFCQPFSSAGQDGCRATLVGRISPLVPSSSQNDKEAQEELEDLKELYLETHAHANDALRYKDLFRFYRMHVDDILFVSGYGVTSQWVSAPDFANADPDPLAFDAPGIIRTLNQNSEADLKRLCRVFLEVEDVATCSITGLDRLGFDVRVKDQRKQTSEFRVGFRETVANRFDVQSALVKTFQEAWERENGFDETWEGEDTRPTILYIRTY